MADFDFAPFATTAAMLYETAFLAERYAGVKYFLHANPAQTIHEGTLMRRPPPLFSNPPLPCPCALAPNLCARFEHDIQTSTLHPVL